MALPPELANLVAEHLLPAPARAWLTANTLALRRRGRAPGAADVAWVLGATVGELVSEYSRERAGELLRRFDAQILPWFPEPRLRVCGCPVNGLYCPSHYAHDWKVATFILNRTRQWDGPLAFAIWEWCCRHKGRSDPFIEVALLRHQHDRLPLVAQLFARCGEEPDYGWALRLVRIAAKHKNAPGVSCIVREWINCGMSVKAEMALAVVRLILQCDCAEALADVLEWWPHGSDLRSIIAERWFSGNLAAPECRRLVQSGNKAN